MATATEIYAEYAWDDLTANGGFSYGEVVAHPDGAAYPKSPRNGYMVGGIVPEVVVPVDQGLVEAATAYMSAVRERNFYDPARYFIGAWVNTETGMVHFDLSVNIDQVDIAMIRAESTGELAIWDVVNAREISLHR